MRSICQEDLCCHAVTGRMSGCIIGLSTSMYTFKCFKILQLGYKSLYETISVVMLLNVYSAVWIWVLVNLVSYYSTLSLRSGILDYLLCVCVRDQPHSQNRSCDLFHIQDYDDTPLEDDARLFGILKKSKMADWRTFFLQNYHKWLSEDMQVEVVIVYLYNVFQYAQIASESQYWDI